MCNSDVKYAKRAFGALFYLLGKVERRNKGIEVNIIILCKPYDIMKNTAQNLY